MENTSPHPTRHPSHDDKSTDHASHTSSVRLKKDSPSLVGLKALKEKQIDALISTGNSGALVSGARLILKTLRGIRTPGLLALLPTLLKPLVVIEYKLNY
jgi:glycerol-3-phosphate acyltransferase PlsX